MGFLNRQTPQGNRQKVSLSLKDFAIVFISQIRVRAFRKGRPRSSFHDCAWQSELVSPKYRPVDEPGRVRDARHRPGVNREL
jgi:hypothetical protein